MMLQTHENSNLLFPVFLKLEQLNTLVVGGGFVGLEKLTALLGNAPGANITLIAPLIREEIQEMAKKHPGLKLMSRKFVDSDLNGRDIIILATDDRKLHEEIKIMTRQRRILTNVADTPDLCDFYLSSIVKKGDLKIAISTNGKSPTVAKRIKEFLNDAIPENMQLILDNMFRIREKLRGDFETKVKVLDNITTQFLEKDKHPKAVHFSDEKS